MRDAYVRGIGQSQVGRRLGRSDLDLTCEAALAAIADAGLTPDEVDGISTYPGANSAAPPGFAGPGAQEVQDALRLTTSWTVGAGEGGAQLSCLVHAAAAVTAGLARNVLVYRTVTEATHQKGGRGAAMAVPTIGGPMQWLMVPGAVAAPNWFGLMATWYQQTYGLTREQLAAVPLSNRAHAARDEKAVYREPLSMDAYLAARMISTPLCLYDCDVPVDGSTAFVVSHVDTVPDAARTPVGIAAVGQAQGGRVSWDQYEAPNRTAVHYAGRSLWAGTDLTPADVDTAQLYDGFSLIALQWLESLGFCAEGEVGPWVEGGARIGLGGVLPLNTAGGQLSGGRLHGLGLVHEAVVQLRGDGGARQVADAEVAVAANGGGTFGAAMLLTRGLG